MASDSVRRAIGDALAAREGSGRLQAVLRSLEALPAASRSRAAEAPPAGAPAAAVALDTVLDHVRDPILTLAADGCVVRANLSAARMFAAAPDELDGLAVTELLPGIAVTPLASLAERVDDTFVDAAPVVFDARRRDGEPFRVEVTVSQLPGEGAAFVLCLRDVTERLAADQALRESEARYRALVENAPEAIVVFDVDANRFVDANDNAARLFKVTREELLRMGPSDITPERQADGMPSFGIGRGYLERALKGGRPTFEWLHRDAEGREFPCEVRFILLPSSQRRLIRASIIDIAARRRADTLAFGERRVLELVAGNAPLERALGAVVRLVEQLHPGVGAAVMLLDAAKRELTLAAHGGLPTGVAAALATLRVGSGAGACGAAVSLGRQVVVRDLASDSLWAAPDGFPDDGSLAACCSTPIVTSGDRIHGTLAVYFDTPRGPSTDELDVIARMAQLAGIAIRRKRDEQALRDSEARFRDLFDNVVDGVFQCALSGDILSANPALVEMLGCRDVSELCALGVADVWVDERERTRFLAALEADGSVRDFEYRLRRRDGSEIDVIANVRVVPAADGRERYYEGTLRDVTAQKAAERALHKEKERVEVTLQSIGDAVVSTDAAGRVDYMNPVAEQLTGWDRRAAEGRPIEDVVALENEASGAAVENPVRRCLGEERTVTLASDVVLVPRDGAAFPIQSSSAAIRDGTGAVVGSVMVFHDASKERQLHRKLAYQASHDSLTGLINRREFEERLSAALRARKGLPKAGALLYMDLDQFKLVNDTCGHGAGDLLLRQLSEVLRGVVPPNDVLARLGGDEFAVLLGGCDLECATQVAERLRSAVTSFRFFWRDSALKVGVSIGIVPLDADSEGIASLLAAADVACYVAKDSGRNRVHVYREGDTAARHQEMQWVARINRALEQERFELYYQPIVPIGARQNTWPHYELLLRMRDEDGRTIGPAEFIPAAERYNLMPALDRWVASQVVETLAYRGEPQVEPYTLAVNLSGTTLNDSRFLDFLEDELSAAALPPGALCFEITETAAIANLHQVVAFMEALKARGCRFSLDDFGTGLSSLTYLKTLPVDYVKIDGHFVRNVTQDTADECVVEAIARMARAFEIETIAERVESREVLRRLGELGVTYAQGFFVAVPTPVSELPVQAARRLRARSA